MAISSFQGLIDRISNLTGRGLPCPKSQLSVLCVNTSFGLFGRAYVRDLETIAQLYFLSKRHCCYYRFFLTKFSFWGVLLYGKIVREHRDSCSGVVAAEPKCPAIGSYTSGWPHLLDLARTADWLRLFLYDTRFYFSVTSLKLITVWANGDRALISKQPQSRPPRLAASIHF